MMNSEVIQEPIVTSKIQEISEDKLYNYFSSDIKVEGLTKSQQLDLFNNTIYKDKSDGFFETLALNKTTGKSEQRFFKKFSEILPYLEENLSFANLYIGAGIRKRFGDGTKENVSLIYALWCDLDIKDYKGGFEELKKRLSEFIWEPNLLIFTGGGIQAYWVLSTPFKINSNEDIMHIEGFLRGIAHELGGDHCHNADRRLRLPGTNNYPNKKKRALGRTEAETRIIAVNETQYDLDDFDDYFMPENGTNSNSGKIVGNINDTTLPTSFIQELNTNAMIKEAWDGKWPDPNKGGRSSQDAHLCFLLVANKQRFTDAEINSILLNFKFGKAPERKDTEKYLSRLIEKQRTYLLEKQGSNEKSQIRTQSYIKEEGNKYLQLNKSAKSSRYDPVTSFVFKPKRIVKTESNEILETDIITESGRTIRSFQLLPSDWISGNSFKKRINIYGDLIFTGTEKAVQEIKLYVFTMSLPTVQGVTFEGIHKFGEDYFYVSGDSVLDKNGKDASDKLILIKKSILD